jgi:predicted GTPase
MDTSPDSKYQVLNLVSKIISPFREDTQSPLAKAIDKLDVFVKDKLMKIFNSASPDNSSELVDAFQLSLERFEEFTLFPAFETKQLIGVGGAFSSGKSMLLNTIIGEKLLPTQIDPSTVVPTFIIHSPQEEVGVINIFNVRSRMSIQEFKSISYDFDKNHNNELRKQIELRHLIKRAFISSSKLYFEHLTLLDTPGYSKPDDINRYSDRTDEAKAREQLRTADFIIWVMDIENGTLKETDIDFLQKLCITKPILIVLSKADKPSSEDVENIRQEVVAKIATIGVVADAVIPFSAAGGSQYPVDPIIEWLRTKNSPKDKSSIPLHLKRIFSEYLSYYNEQIGDAIRRLEYAKKVATVVETQDDGSKQCLRDIETEARNHFKEFQELEAKLRDCQKEFFGIVKEVGEMVGIELPEPDEIDMLKNTSLDLKELLHDYCKKHNIKPSSIDEEIQDKFSDKRLFNDNNLSWYQSSASIFNQNLDLSKLNDQEMDFLQQAFSNFTKVKVVSFIDILNKLINKIDVKLEV